ncbi:MAG: deoxyribose-phosphate aldolase [Syntrophomonadaceae bacterium]|nr:deoxyribose-phosphate aldolase [Syntrophomonadaceae bacterium]MDD4549494.1 deoxyribose-phosphate aldolase [Syntrophomonadaceae bacterium]
MIASYLDSTNLKPEATGKDIELLCKQAIQYKMAAVCINPYRITAARDILKGTSVNISTVIGFPLGADGLRSKLNTSLESLKNGANELDMVINIGALKERDYKAVENEIASILLLKKDFNFILKVIVETALIGEKELEEVTLLVNNSQADYIKTSTGFASRGASLKDIEIIKAHKSDRLKIKASGGIRKLDFALQLINAGVERIGSSNAAKLVEEFRQRGGL